MIKIINTKLDINDPKLKAEVPTDQTLFNALANEDLGEHSLVNFPSEKGIRKLSENDLYHVEKCVQDFIDETTQKEDKKYIFLCQHIYVERIMWYGNLVFTPHLSQNCPPNIRSVPHYSMFYSDAKSEKDILFSFQGASHTYPIRKNLVEKYDSCSDTKGWMSDNKDDRKRYLDKLARTYFSLCPRGTGIGSIRIFEAMAMKSVPVIIADGFVPPLDWLLNWDEFSVKISENDWDKIPEILNKFTKSDMEKMCGKAYEVWKTYFCPEKMHEVVKLELKRG